MEHFDWISGAVIPYTNFLIFATLLVYFGRKPIAGIVQKRYQDYVDAHALAKQAFQDAAEKNEEIKSKLANLDNEIKELKDIALQNAKHEYDAMMSQAKALGAHIVDEARMIADAEVEMAREEIREEIVKTLIGQVQDKIKNDLDQGKHASIIDQQSQNVASLALDGANV